MKITPVIQDLIDQVSAIYQESGDKTISFDATTWTLTWLASPCPALNHKNPQAYLSTTQGINQVKQVLACLQSGTYL